ncbi:DUF6265 family protein [Flagellimonas algicola]|uniref:DUF6265 domain-containing protein n=1 Tax=Flagellimonas algicola TaxID=2583815 RepID=A0ABY2WJ66_9FLAO|nr:DUF6265 family protein [Allomuricauda algicola]TMU54753.1 hypothetical protein FGG15_11165 [Allomuricauda algicola]
MRLLIPLLLLNWGLTHAQNTLQLEEGESSPNATLDGVAWIEGSWQGEALGGKVEEIWSPALGGSMMFSFKLVHDGKISFYEFGHIQEKDNTLVLQLKHFNGNLTGWETQKETVDFKLVKLEKDKVYFEGLTMEKLDGDEMQVSVVVGQEGKTKELVFNYRKYY